MSERDPQWDARPTSVKDAWFMVVHAGGVDPSDGTKNGTMRWPDEKPLELPDTVVMMSVAAFADLCHRAGVR